MKKKYTLLLQSFIIFFLCMNLGQAQVNLYSQDFESADFDTYQLLNSSGSAVLFGTTGTDYIVRATPASLPLGNTVTGFSGNVIAFEDHDGAGFFGQHSIDTDVIDISGATGITFKFRLAAARGNDGNRYETGDFLQVQVNIDGGGFQTIINTGGTSVDNRYYYDSDNNGITTADVLVNQNSQEISTTISGTGNSMIVRVLFDSQGPQEEILFDDLSVDAAMVLSTNELSLDNRLTVYPNPSNGIINIQNTGIALETVKIIDLNGRTLFNRNLGGITTNTSLNVTSVLSTGIYLMRISSEDASTVKKITIK